MKKMRKLSQSKFSWNKKKALFCIFIKLLTVDCNYVTDETQVYVSKIIGFVAFYVLNDNSIQGFFLFSFLQRYSLQFGYHDLLRITFYVQLSGSGKCPSADECPESSLLLQDIGIGVSERPPVDGEDEVEVVGEKVTGR